MSTVINQDAHSARPTLDYPLTYSSVRLNGPTLFYIDQEGTPIQMGLNDNQVQMIIDEWNAQPGDSTSCTLKSPKGLPGKSLKQQPKKGTIENDSQID